MNPTMAAIRDKDDAHPLGVVGWRSEYHAMRAALDAVLALHQPGEGRSQGWKPDGRYGEIEPYCAGCEASDEYAVTWPCKTVRAITAHLDIEPR